MSVINSVPSLTAVLLPLAIIAAMLECFTLKRRIAMINERLVSAAMNETERYLRYDVPALDK